MDNMTDTREIPTIALPGNVIMPMVGFGTWPMRGQKACVAVATALQTGYRHLDTATMYANEEEVGRAVRDSGLPRQDVFLTSKLRAGDAARENQRVRLAGAAGPPRRGAHPRGRGEQLLAGPDRRACRGHWRGPGGEPDPVEPAALRRGPAGRAAVARRGCRGVQPAEGHQPERPGADRDRLGARRHARAGCPAVAPGTRHRGHPEVRRPEVDRDEPGSVRLRARPRGGRADRRPGPLTARAG